MEKAGGASMNGVKSSAFAYELISEKLSNKMKIPVGGISLRGGIRRMFMHGGSRYVNPTSLSLSRAEGQVAALDSIWKCGECGMNFEKEKAMFGHMRIHSVPKQTTTTVEPMSDHKIFNTEPEPERCATRVSSRDRKKSADHDIFYTDVSTDQRVPSKRRLCVTSKKRGWDLHLQENSTAEDVALFLIDLSRSDGKTHICENCNRSFQSQQDLRQHLSCSQLVEIRKNEVLVPEPESTKHKSSGGKKLETTKTKRKLKKGIHPCEFCGQIFDYGHQLGGHKRAHYIKPRIDQ